jgi:hypothetical protein
MTVATTTDDRVDTDPVASSPPSLGEVVYRFQGRLGTLNPLGLFADGIRFHNQFEGRVIEGPFAGGRIYGIDHFLQRADGVGEIRAPEVVELDQHRISLEVRGYVVPPTDVPVPPLEAMLDPSFEFPDVLFRVTGSAIAATTSEDHDALNRATIIVEGTVNLSTGALDVTARTVDPPVTDR